MNKIWNESSKLNRLLIFCLIISILFICITFYFYNEAVHSRDADAKVRVEEVSEQYKSAVINQINGDIATLVGISTIITPTDLTNEDVLLDYFNKIVQQNEFLRVSFTRTNGYAFMIDNKGNKSFNVDFRNREDINLALKGKTNLSSSFKDEITKEYINCYAVPVYIEDEIVGAITAVHKSERFYNMITKPIFNGEGQTTIVDSEGNFVIRLMEDKQEFFNLNEFIDEEYFEKVCNEVKNQNCNAFDIDINNENYICVISPLGINEWSIITLVPINYFHLGYERLIAIFTFALVTIIITFIIVSLFVKRIIKESRKSIINLAYYDSLTGIYNRNRYMDVVTELMKNDNSYVFVLLDISNFKFINETYGYEAGNKLLKHVANVLNKHMLKGEVCFRDNADCFGLLMHYVDNDSLEIRLNKIVSEIGTYTFDSNEYYNIICNCGIKIIDKHLKNGKDIDMIFDRALLALEKAKGNHVSTFVYFNGDMEEQSKRKFRIENSMRFALERHEFQMYLQPKVYVKSGEIIGAEALVRWIVDDKVAYYPDEFIPIFEENGFICELDLYMLQEVCLCLKHGIEQGFTMFPISVNQSKVLFYRSNYLESLKQILELYEIDPSLIIIEVTETVTMENMKGVKEVIDGLHKLGFRVSLDDFGSGYSSLNVLQKLDIDELKLDREFLISSDHEEKQKKVIKSVVQLAKELNISTVSEGVETNEQLEFLKSIQCDTAQGYYYSKPVPYAVLMKKIYAKGNWMF